MAPHQAVATQRRQHRANSRSARSATGNDRTFTAGSGWVVEELVPAAPNTKLLVEDQFQIHRQHCDSYGIALNAADAWGSVLATFRRSGGQQTGAADLTLTKTHVGTFTQGQTGATYTLTVTNSGTGATSRSRQGHR